MSALSNCSIAVLATDGVEEVELTEPVAALKKAGATVTLVSIKSGKIQAMKQDVNAAGLFDVDLQVSEADASRFDGLLLPGGTTNPDALRQDEAAVAFVRAFTSANKAVAAICHGPWLLIEADAVRGRKIASWPSLKTDLRDAGATWVD